MSFYRTINFFAKRPWSSAVLAALMLCLGVVFVSDWVPDSLYRRYFPGHRWFMASLSWVTAFFFVHCARVGLRPRGVEGQKIKK